MDKDLQQMGEEPVSRLLVKFSLPAIIGIALDASYLVVDGIFIGHGIGSIGIAAITAVFPVMMVLMAFGVLIGLGAGIQVSLFLGGGKREEAEKVLGNALFLVIVFSLILMIIGLLFSGQLLLLLGVDGKLLPYANEYIRIILLGSVFMGTGAGINNLIGAEGNPFTALKTAFLGVAINAFLCPLFIFGLGLGLTGAALATVLAEAGSAAWILFYFSERGRGFLKMRISNLSPDISTVKTILTTGMPAFVMEIASAVVAVTINTALLTYGGNTALAAIGIINSLGMLIVMPVFGLSQGAQPIIGYNYGACRFDRVMETVRAAMSAATVILIGGFLIIQFFSKELVSIFCTSDPALIAFGGEAIRIFMLMIPLAGFQVIAAGYFQATGKPREAMLYMLSRQVLLIILISLFPPVFGLNGILYAGPVSDLMAAVLTGTGFWYDLKREGLRYQI
jgi:putative MATE family efflux protein